MRWAEWSLTEINLIFWWSQQELCLWFIIHFFVRRTHVDAKSEADAQKAHEDDTRGDTLNYDNPEVVNAATTIQAGFKGYKARKQVQELKVYISWQMVVFDRWRWLAALCLYVSMMLIGCESFLCRFWLAGSALNQHPQMIRHHYVTTPSPWSRPSLLYADKDKTRITKSVQDAWSCEVVTVTLIAHSAKHLCAFCVLFLGENSHQVVWFLTWTPFDLYPFTSLGSTVTHSLTRLFCFSLVHFYHMSAIFS